MDFVKLNADQNLILNKHFTPGRGGKRINKIVIHHNAANLSIQQCYNVWQTRRASAHYQVDINGRVGQLVWDGDTAWHAGNGLVNQTSIGIEHANNNTTAWTVSPATLDSGAHLVAGLCRAFGLGRPQWGVNVFPHKAFTATACPGALYGAQKGLYIQKAQSYYDQMMGKAGKAPTPAPKTTPPPPLNLNRIARDVIQGKYGNGPTRKARLGKLYAPVMAIVNKMLG